MVGFSYENLSRRTNIQRYASDQHTLLLANTALKLRKALEYIKSFSKYRLKYSY